METISILMIVGAIYLLRRYLVDRHIPKNRQEDVDNDIIAGRSLPKKLDAKLASNREKCLNSIAYIKPLFKNPEHGSQSIGLDISYDDQPVTRKISDEFAVHYLVDTGSQFEYILNRYIAEAKLDADELHQIAIKNLACIASKKMRIKSAGMLMMVTLDGQFEASLYLIDEIWDTKLKSFGTDGIAVAIPARDVLLFCNADSKEGMDEMRKILSNPPTSSHPVSNSIRIRKNSSWSIIK